MNVFAQVNFRKQLIGNLMNFLYDVYPPTKKKIVKVILCKYRNLAMKARPLCNLSIFLLCYSVCRCGPVDEIPKNITASTTKETIVPVIPEPEPPKQNVSKNLVNLPHRGANDTITTPMVVLVTPKTVVTTAIVTPSPLPKVREESAPGGQIITNKTEPLANVTISQTPKPVLSVPVVQNSTAPATNAPNSTVSSSSSTNTTSITTPTTKATTNPTNTTTIIPPKPKKPTITYSVEDEPSIANVSRKQFHDQTSFGGKLAVEEPEQPIAQPSLDMSMAMPPIHRDFVIPILAMIFAVPIIMGGIIVSMRRLKDYWSTRHYRRMDFLVDGMYND